MTRDRDVEEGVRMYTLFDRPTDWPHAIVVRAFTVQKDGTALADRGGIVFAMVDGAEETRQLAIEQARRHCRALGKVQLERHPQDDAKILEVWL